MRKDGNNELYYAMTSYEWAKSFAIALATCDELMCDAVVEFFEEHDPREPVPPVSLDPDTKPD